MLKKVAIKSVKINQLFAEISQEHGYDFNNYFDDLFVLIEKWEQEKCVEIYKVDDDRAYGRAKESDSDGKGKLIIEYIGVYHTRLRRHFNDPLLVVKFCEDDEGHPYVSVRFITDHNKMFGDFSIKHVKSSMKSLRESVDEQIHRGDGKD